MSAIWNCKQCFLPLHLGCIRRWIKKVNSELAVENAMPYENRKEEIDENGVEDPEGRVGLTMNKDGAISIDKTN
jgi:hypothetical protein